MALKPAKLVGIFTLLVKGENSGCYNRCYRFIYQKLTVLWTCLWTAKTTVENQN